MRIFDLITLSIKNSLRKKTSLLIVILIIVVSSAFVFSISYESSFNNYWINYQNSNPEFRIRVVNYSELLDPRIKRQDDSISINEKNKIINDVSNRVNKILISNNYILGATSEQFWKNQVNIIEFANNKQDGLMQIIGVPKINNIKIVDGRNILNNNEIVCPNLITASSNIDNNSKYDINNLISINNYINKKVHFKINNLSIMDDYQIVGLYDTFSNYSIGNTCFASYEMLESLINKYYLLDSKVKTSIDEYHNSKYYMGENVYVMIDDIRHLSDFQQMIRENKLNENAIVNINTSTVDDISSICKYITIITLIFIILFLIVTILNDIHKRVNELNTYKIIGYRNSDITKLIFVENSIVIIIGYIISIIFVHYGFIIYRNTNLINKSRLYLMIPHIDLLRSFLILISLLTIPIIITIIFKMLLKKSDLIMR